MNESANAASSNKSDANVAKQISILSLCEDRISLPFCCVAVCAFISLPICVCLFARPYEIRSRASEACELVGDDS